MSAITTDTLADYLGVTFDSTVEVRAQMVLDNLQGEAEAYFGRPIEVRAFQDDYDWDGSDDMLSLRNTPVVGVSSIVARSISGTGVVEDALDAGYYTVTKWGLRGLQARGFGYPYVLRVTYTAGFDMANPKYMGIRSAILKAGERWYHSAVGAGSIVQQSGGGAIKSFSADGGYSVTFSDGGPLNGGAAGIGSFYPGELTPLVRFKRKG